MIQFGTSLFLHNSSLGFFFSVHPFVKIFYLTYQDVTSRVQNIGSTFLVSAVTGGSISFVKFSDLALLTLKVPITPAAEDIHKYFFIVFQRK